MPIPSPGLRLEEVTEPVVIAMAASGNSDAFAELMRRRQAGIRRFMRQLCRNPDLADDLAQQVFLRTWRSLGKLKSLEAFNGWLKRIMVSVWIDEIRQQRTDVRGTAPLSEELEQGGQSAPALERDLEWALSHLEPRTRLCVLLAYGEGHSHNEIAALLSIPLGTAKSLVTRGADRMRSLLGDYQRD